MSADNFTFVLLLLGVIGGLLLLISSRLHDIDTTLKTQNICVQQTGTQK